MNNINLDIDSYNINELLELFNLEDDISLEELNNKMKPFFIKYKDNIELYNFLNKAKTKIKDHIENIDADVEGEILYDNEYIPGNNKELPDRKNYTRIINNEHNIIGRERLPIGQGFGVDAIQGQLNPNYKNIQKKVINIDSSFRDDNTSISNYVLDLSEPLYNVISLSLLSVEIPLSYYVFDSSYGNTVFYIYNSTGPTYTAVNIDNGNYSYSELQTEIQQKLTAIGNGWTITYIENQNKMRITHSAGGDRSVIFYDSSNNIPNSLDGFTKGKINYNFGSFLGFPNSSYVIPNNVSITSSNVVNTFGSRYFEIIVDDYKKNRMNNCVINPYDSYKTFSKPIIGCDISSNSLPLWQQYVNTQKNLSAETKQPNKYYGNVNSDVLAKVPIAKLSTSFNHLVAMNSNFGEAKRQYFGPVNLERLRIIIVNDNGLEVNFNGMEYSLSLLCESLYQY
jgi:hypothetical protein